MSLRKIAALLAAAGLAVGLIGSGVGAQFTGQVSATENIHVGTFGCIISSYSAGTISTDKTSLVYNAPDITSSAAGSDPLNFTVTSTGSIPVKLQVSQTTPPAPFASLLVAPVADVTLTQGQTHEYDAGMSWTELSNANLGTGIGIVYTINCVEANAAAGTVIFDNTPATLPGNLQSYGAQAYSFNEWGGGVTFAGTARKLSAATVTMSSWACQSGDWTVPFGTTGTCVTTPGATYNVPITFNVYNVNAGKVGSLITSVTQTFAIPYRPSSVAPATCSDGEAWKDAAGNCDHGIAYNAKFTFPAGTTLPDTAIFGVTYNTDTSGYAPIGLSPADALNIAANPGTASAVQASVGTWLPSDTMSYVAPRGASTMVGTSPVANMPTGAGDNFVGAMPAVQITAAN